MLKKISHLVKYQFPEFYRENGDNFIAFMEAYYEWMEQEGNINSKLRSVTDLLDIDKTSEDFLKHFAKTYMSELPPEIIGNQRLFQKHILDIYRTKGSEAGVRLLFRLLFNEDIGLYIPSYDIFAASDGKWVERNYIEVAYNKNFPLYQGRVITGMDSQSRAFVENAISFTKRGFRVYALYITNIRGNFRVGESISAEGLDIPFTEMLRINGSPVEVDVVASGIGFENGDIFEFSEHSDDMKLVVSETGTATGTMEFRLEDGGTYYSMDANVNITAGSNTSGGDAIFEIASIRDTQDFGYSIESLVPYGDIPLNEMAYGFPTNPSANSENLIMESITINEVEVGTIDRIRVINPGGGYDGSVNIEILDPYTSNSMIPDGKGGFGGRNAVVSGRASMGVGTILGLKVISSGHAHYEQGRNYVLESDKGPVNFNIRLGGIGIEEGYFDNMDGFPSDGKYLFDGHYYQEYSYVVRSSKKLEDYRDVLLKTVHSAGNALFGELRINNVIDFDIDTPPEYTFVRQLLEIPLEIQNVRMNIHYGVARFTQIHKFDTSNIEQVHEIADTELESIAELFARNIEQDNIISIPTFNRIVILDSEDVEKSYTINPTSIKQRHIFTSSNIIQNHTQTIPQFGYKVNLIAYNMNQNNIVTSPKFNRILEFIANDGIQNFEYGNIILRQKHSLKNDNYVQNITIETPDISQNHIFQMDHYSYRNDISDVTLKVVYSLETNDIVQDVVISPTSVEAIDAIRADDLVIGYVVESPMLNGFIRETTDEDARITVDGKPRRTNRK